MEDRIKVDSLEGMSGVPNEVSRSLKNVLEQLVGSYALSDDLKRFSDGELKDAVIDGVRNFLRYVDDDLIQGRIKELREK